MDPVPWTFLTAWTASAKASSQVLRNLSAPAILPALWKEDKKKTWHLNNTLTKPLITPSLRSQCLELLAEKAAKKCSQKFRVQILKENQGTAPEDSLVSLWPVSFLWIYFRKKWIYLRKKSEKNSDIYIPDCLLQHYHNMGKIEITWDFQ